MARFQRRWDMQILQKKKFLSVFVAIFKEKNLKMKGKN